MHDVFKENFQELYTWRQQTFGWAKCVVAHPTQILGAWAMAHPAHLVPPPMGEDTFKCQTRDFID